MGKFEYDYDYNYGESAEGVTPSAPAILLETSGYIQMETGDFLLLE